MRSIRRSATAILASALVATVGLAFGPAKPASADPVWDLNWSNVTGQTVLAKPKTTVVIPKSTFFAKLDLGTGKLTGDFAVPELTMKMKVFGFAPVTSTVRLVPVGQTTADVDLANGKLVSTTRFYLQPTKVSADWLPGINLVSSGCTTKIPSEAVMVNTGKIDIWNGTPLAGEFAISEFKNCGILTGLLTNLISGPGNTMSITLA